MKEAAVIEGSTEEAELTIKGITKRFPGALANDRIDFSVRKGEIHALLGENGAGKTTLMNVLYGLLQPDEGEIWVRGQKVELRSPKDAIALGIGMVHQHFMLVPSLPVTQNVTLGLRSSREPFLDNDQVEMEIHKYAEKYGLHIDPHARISQLSIGEQQRVEVIKLLYRNAEFLILDEPTALLTPHESDELMAILRSMADQGRTIIFITHKLREVFQIADRVTVLRDGRAIDTLRVSDTSQEALARMMVGREVKSTPGKAPVQTGQVILSVEGVRVTGDRGSGALRGISLSLSEGEILGIAGVDGNGQDELVEAIVGLRAVDEGRIIIKGQDVTGKAPNHIYSLGTAYIPSDRLKRGMVHTFSVAENIVLETHDQPPFSSRGFLRLQPIAAFARKLIKEFDIRPPNEHIPARLLSGGNLQKMILGRELSRHPRLLIAAQPTRGLDIAATQFVRNHLLEQRAGGIGILLVSADLDEILTVSDRIAIIFEGKIVGVVDGEEADVEEIGLMMAGGRPTQPSHS